jgi:hypothetical protein
VVNGAGHSATSFATQPAMISVAPRPVKAGKRGLFGSVRVSVGRYGRKGAGVSMAAQQRASRKARNVARSRRR